MADREEGTVHDGRRDGPIVFGSYRLTALEPLLREVRACQTCAAVLPLGARPILQASATARILIASQAPGTKAHMAGVPFADPSGDRLREWMGLSLDQFYDASTVAIIPMGLCYPGRLPAGGDAPPRPECAAKWRARLLEQLSALRLTLLVGTYAQVHALGPGTMTNRVFDAASRSAGLFALPHPSWRTRSWALKHPGFDRDVLPALRTAIGNALS